MAETQILVLGATGSVGRRVVAQLRERGHDVRAASRRGEVQFDWHDPQTWQQAVAGASAAFVMAPDDIEVDPEFVGVAVSGGVQHLVLLSSKGIEVMHDARLLRAERVIRDSGAGWSIVRPDWFSQNFDEGVLRDAVLAGEVALPLGDMRQAFNDADDIAAVAVTALTEDGHTGQTYELSGPDALTFHEAADTISHASGHRVRYRGGADDYIHMMTQFGVDQEQVRRDVEAFEALRAGGDAVVTDTVERVTRRPPKPFGIYAAEAARRGAWSVTAD